MFMLLALLSVLGPRTVLADYNCVCNYNVEQHVMARVKDDSSTIGYLYEFDCKQLLVDPQLDDTWKAITYQHQKGYVQLNPKVQVQICAGDPSTDDILTTSTTTQNTKMSETSIPTTIIPKTTVMFTSGTTSHVTNPTTSTSPTTQMPSNTPSSTERMTSSTTDKTTIPSTTVDMTTIKTTMPTVKTRFETTSVPTTLPTTTSNAIISGNTGLCSQSKFSHQSDVDLGQYGHNCYAIIPHGVAWSHANYICNQEGASLLHIGNQAEQDYMYNLLTKVYNQPIWTGLHDRNHEEHFEWVSGEPVNYLNWKPGRKNIFYPEDEDCAVLDPRDHGLWDDVDCGADIPILEHYGEEHAFVCQFKTNNYISSTLQPQTNLDGDTNLCPPSVQQDALFRSATLGQYNKGCYELLPTTKYTWTHGESICQGKGGHLAHISNEGQQLFVQGFMDRHSPAHAVWIGLHDLNVEGNFQWTSGNSVQYTNWIFGHTSNFVDKHVENCVVFLPYHNGTWDDVPCGQADIFGGEMGETHPLLCQYKIRSASGSVLVG